MAAQLLLGGYSRLISPLNDVIGDFPFDTYCVARLQDAGTLEERMPHGVVKVVHFASPSPSREAVCTGGLLLLTSIPVPRMTAHLIAQLVEDVRYLAQHHSFDHVHVRNHPRDISDLKRTLEMRLENEGFGVSCRYGYFTLQENLVAVDLVAGVTSTALGECLSYLRDLDETKPVYELIQASQYCDRVEENFEPQTKQRPARLMSPFACDCETEAMPMDEGISLLAEIIRDHESMF